MSAWHRLFLLASLTSFAVAAQTRITTTAAAAAPAAAFSSLKPGQLLPAPMRFVGLPKTKHNVASLVEQQGATVLKVDSNNSAGTVALPFSVEMKNSPLLTWRWRVSRVLSKADMEHKTADDFAARVYVFFDVPLASLSFSERTKIRLARAIAGADVPTAALCYVWDNKHRIDYMLPSPYTSRVQRIVVESGPDKVGQWIAESRDVATDFKKAFGHDAPRITGVAIGNDTDNTDEKVTTWFGDVSFENKK